MQKIVNFQKDVALISELYRYRTGSGELRCHRLDIPEGNAGELLLRVEQEENVLRVEEVFVKRQFRKMGLGSRLLREAEYTANVLGLDAVELMPFSNDPVMSDVELREWYRRRGYISKGVKMQKIITDIKETT